MNAPTDTWVQALMQQFGTPGAVIAGMGIFAALMLALWLFDDSRKDT